MEGEIKNLAWELIPRLDRLQTRHEQKGKVEERCASFNERKAIEWDGIMILWVWEDTGLI